MGDQFTLSETTVLDLCWEANADGPIATLTIETAFIESQPDVPGWLFTSRLLLRAPFYDHKCICTVLSLEVDGALDSTPMGVLAIKAKGEDEHHAVMIANGSLHPTNNKSPMTFEKLDTPFDDQANTL